MKKNGFTFIETIITVVVLSATLMILYNAYSKIIYNEETRINYNDVAYLYRTNYLVKFIKENIDDISDLVEDINNTTYAITFGDKYFLEDNVKNNYNSIINSFNIHQVYVASSLLFDCSSTMDNESDSHCNIALATPWLRDYIKTVSVNDKKTEYYIIVEYSEGVDISDNNGDKLLGCTKVLGGNDSDTCQTYYSILKLYTNSEVPKYELPSVSLSATSTYNSITLTVNAISGSNPVSSYCFKKGSEEYICKSSNTHPYNNLTQGTKYLFTVQVADTNGQTATTTTEVTTESYFKPSITKVNYDAQFDSVKLTVTAKAGTAAISKYEYRFNGGEWEDNGSSNVINKGDLNTNTNYSFIVRVKDVNGVYSEASNVNVKTPVLYARDVYYENDYTICKDLDCALNELIDLIG